jgi:ABC-type bacteriocin/lantibiotic exporter with double-glycine peptidase domain
MRLPAWRSTTGRVIVVISLLGGAGCSYFTEATTFDPKEFDTTPGWVAVRSVPVVLQEEMTDCGAASLAMVLSHWKLGTTLEDVTRKCPMIPEKGIRAKDLRDYAKACGLRSYLIHGRWEDLQKEVGLGRPLIVGLVKPDGSGIITHYEVVAAIHPELQSIVTIDPARGWCRNSRSAFCREWEPAGFLTLVFLREDPSQPEAGR